MIQDGSPHGLKPTDDELMELVQKGDRSSFAALFQRHGPPVFRYARLLTGALPDAQDLTQEVFLKAYTQRMAYRKMGMLKQWLFTICRNLRIDQQRRRGVRPVPTDLDTLPGRFSATPEAASPNDKGHFLSHALVRTFPAETKEVLFLRIVEELSFQEVADLTNKSVESLRQLVSRALRIMRNQEDVRE